MPRRFPNDRDINPWQKLRGHLDVCLVATDGTIKAGAVGASALADGTILNVHVNASAAIAYSKLGATGDDTDIDIDLIPKGAGVVNLGRFATIGDSAPIVKMVKLTGTSPAVGASGTIAHGLADRAKIISAQVLVSNNSGNRIPPGFTSVNNHEFDFFIDSTNVYIYCIAANSSNIDGNAVTVVIIYEQ